MVVTAQIVSVRRPFTHRSQRSAAQGSSALGGHRGGGFLRGLRVEVGAARDGGAQVVVELVAQRDAGGDVQARDVLVGDAVELLDERAQRVAVRGQQHDLAATQV